MKSHPLGIKTVYELYDRKGGDLIYSYNNSQASKAEVEVKINNPGKPTKTILFPFRSYVSNFPRVLENAFLAVDNSTAGVAIDKIIETTTGGATNPAAAIHTMAVNEGALTASAQSTFGIWIGDMDNTSGLGLTIETGIGGIISYNDYMLRAQLIANGGSPDTDINYLVTNVAFSNSDNTLTISRRFENVGLTDIKVTEIGLVGKSGTDYFLLARDLVTLPNTLNPFPLDAGGTIEVSYIFTITPTSGWTQNYLKILSSEFVAGNAVSQVRDLTNAGQTVNFSTARTQKDLLAAIATATYGIVVGGHEFGMTDGDTNYNTTTYDIHDRVIEGVLQNQLSHSVVTPIVMEQSNNKTTFGLQRDFERIYTIGSFLVHSSGLIVRQGTSPYKYFLIAHDGVPTVASQIGIQPNQVLRVKYIFEAPLGPERIISNIGI